MTALNQAHNFTGLAQALGSTSLEQGAALSPSESFPLLLSNHLIVIEARGLTLLSSGLISLVLAAYLLWRHKQRRAARLAALGFFLYAGYDLWFAGMFFLQDSADAALWWRNFLPLGSMALAGLFHFSAAFSRTEGKAIQRLVALTWLATFVITALELSQIFPLSMVQIQPGRWFAKVDPVYFDAYLPLLVWCLCGSLVLVGRRILTAPTKIERNQLKFFFFAIIPAGSFAFLSLLFGLPWLGYLDTLVFIGVMFYAITRYQLFDLSRFFSRSAFAEGLAFVLLAILLGGFFAIMEGALVGVGITALPRCLVLVGVLLVLVGPMSRSLRGLTSRFFDVRILGFSERQLAYSQLLVRQPRLADYLNQLCSHLVDDLDLQYMSLLTRERATGNFSSVARHPQGLMAVQILDAASPLARVLRDELGVVDREVLEWEGDTEESRLAPELRREVAEQMRGMGAALAVAVRSKGALEGMLLLGPRRQESLFSANDRAFLAALALQLATAVENAHLAEQVQQADRMSLLGTMAASMAHEIRNPLTSISLFVQMLPERHEQPEFRERFQVVMSDEIRKLNHLTEQLLTFARAKPHEFKAVPVNALCERAYELLRFQFLKKRVALELKLEAATLAQVNGDEAQLSQVMINLLLNALQATADGGRVVLASRSAGPGWMEIQVTDNGCGMSPAQAARVFEPFYTTKDTGTGLGLATCQRVAMEHSGEITLQSELGKGASFTLRLPAVEASPSEDEALAQRREVG